MNVPFPRNPYFTGREEVLAKLRAVLLEGKKASLTQVISGLGGIGKTQTALEYAYRHQDDYRYIFWIKADTHELLTSDFVAMASLLNLPVKDDKDQNLAVAAVKTWLQNNTGWLLIFDNADNLETAYKFLPQSSQGHSILTTRILASGSEIQNVELETMTHQEGITFLLRQAKLLALDTALDSASEDHKNKAGEIVDMLGALPLALAQAGAYIERRRCGLAGYIERYQLRRSKLLSEPGGLVSGQNPVATTWSLSFEKIAESDPTAANLLCLCAFLHPDAIPEEIMYLDTEKPGSDFKPIAEDVFALDDAIEELFKYSLIRRNQDEKTLTIHRLVQVILKDSMNEQTQRHWAEYTVQLLNQALPEIKFEMWPRCQRLLTHIQTCAKLIAQWTIITPEAAHLLTETGHYLTERGQYLDAASLLTQAMKIHEQSENPVDLDIALTSNYLAELYREQGKYKEAEPLYLRALALREQTLNDEHPDIATSLNNLAGLYESQGKYREAEPLYERALGLRERVLGAEHPDVATSLNDLAGLYESQGKYREVEPLYERALGLRERVLGAEHPNVATSLNNLAGLYQAQGKYQEAELLYKRALGLNERVLGGEHPNVATSLANLAGLYESQGRYQEAEPLYERALGLRERVLGAEHPDVANSLNNLAELYGAQKKYQEAEPLFEQALRLCERVLGAEHPNVATCLNNLAEMYREQGKYEEAEPLYERALRLRERVLGAEHPNVAMNLSGLAALYQLQGRFIAAKQLYLRARKIQEKVLGSKHPDLAKTLVNLAALYNVQRNFTQAEPLILQALSIFEQTIGPEHPDTIQTLKSYVNLLINAKRSRKAAEIQARIDAIEGKL